MSRLAVRSGVERVHVVVPAHDEEGLLPRCLASVHRALAALRASLPHLETRLTVVADRCRDATVALAAACPDTDVVELEAGCVGAARRAGVQRVAELAGRTPARGVWVANTDADSVVPEHWLLAQVHLASAGFDLVTGSVAPDARDLAPGLWRRWRERHHLGEGHPHVHGANLGFTLAAYQAAGGFPATPLHEDVLLVEAVRRAGFRSCATSATHVVTSARHRGRADGGFADYLAALAELPAS